MNAELKDALTSLMPGRARLRHPALKDLDGDTCQMLTDAVAGLQGVESVRVNPRVGSLLITWDEEQTDAATLLQTLQPWAQMLVADAPNASCPAAARACQANVNDLANKALDGLARVLAPDVRAGGRARRTAQNRLMLALGTGSVSSLALGKNWHAGLGWGFVAMLALHLWQHRKVV